MSIQHQAIYSQESAFPSHPSHLKRNGPYIPGAEAQGCTGRFDKGKRFLVLTFSLENPGTEGYSAFPPDFIRLHYGGTTIALEQAVIGNAAAGTTNVPGLVSFLVPQDITTATFILLPGHTPGATNQATISFQIP